MSFYSAKKSVNTVKRYNNNKNNNNNNNKKKQQQKLVFRERHGVTWQAALLNCSKVERTVMWAGRAFQWMIDLRKM